MIAFDLTRHQRLIGVGGDGDGRIRGTFVVLGPLRDTDTTYWIHAHDVVIYDESHHHGVIVGADDFKGIVTAGVPELSIVRDRRKHDIAEVEEEMLKLLLMIVSAYNSGVGSEIREPGEIREGWPVPAERMPVSESTDG